MNLNTTKTSFPSQPVILSEAKNLWIAEERGEKPEMFRFAQHDKSKKLDVELYQNLTLNCTRRTYDKALTTRVDSIKKDTEAK